MANKLAKAFVKTRLGKKIRLAIKKRHGDYSVANKSKCKFTLYLDGKGHKIIIEENVKLEKPYFQFRGTNNTLIIKKGVRLGKDCAFFLEGNGLTITIDENSSFVQKCSFHAQEENLSIYVGKGCLFSHDIIVRTSDAHPIFDLNTKERLNIAKSVVIEDSVWVAPHSEIFKGATVGKGSIIGSNTTVTKSVPQNSLVVGRPQKIIKENVFWTHEDVLGVYKNLD